MGKIAITFDVNNREYFDKLKEYMRLYYANIFIFAKSKDSLTITDGKKIEESYIVINNIDYDIYQYQKASIICQQIMTRALPKATQKKVSTRNNCVISVTSIKEGEQRTTFSQEICSRLVKPGKQVLYLLLDSFLPMEGKFSGDDEHDISQLIYYIEQGKDIQMAIEALKSFDQTHHVSFIRCLYPSIDGFIKKDTAIKLVTALIECSSYDFTVIELPRNLVKGQIELMKAATHNVIITKQNNKSEEIYLAYLESKLEKHYITCKINEGSIVEQILKGSNNGK